jgi:hypothetical protein
MEFGFSPASNLGANTLEKVPENQHRYLASKCRTEASCAPAGTFAAGP